MLNAISGVKKVVLAVAMLAPALAFSAPTTVVNGSFEDPVLGAGNTSFYDVGSTAITGWTVVGGSNVQLVNSTFGAPDYTLPASNGSQWVDLTGGNEGIGKGLTQTFAGRAGFYLVEFDLGKMFSAGNPFVSVNFNGDIQTFSNTTSGSGNILSWAHEQYYFFGAASNTITFTGAAGGSTGLIGIDNVTVTAVPEPESLALMMAGIGALGFMSRRRKYGA
jgi:hypothetical protein